MKILTALLLSVTLLVVSASCEKSADITNPKVSYDSSSIFFYSFTDINGEEQKLSDMKGKKIMFVNTASYCVNTPQYDGLERLYNRYKDRLIIIGFPCNDFGHQEPGSRDSIKEFCARYDITFPLSQKIEILSQNIHPIYKCLTTKELNGKFSSTVDWNFQKYLINEKGELAKVISPKTLPTDPEIINWIKS